ncbi:MAG: hypothetical protein SAK29_38695, partial [Scytonema sp. PMC 1069.18]|nr:hypothetical protein [Scytonema sp. PMC 1069.18]
TLTPPHPSLMQLLNKQNKKTNILPVFAVATFGLNVITLLLLMFHGSMLERIRRVVPESLVQLADGRTITVSNQEYLERNPETIRRFVGKTMTLMFTWSEKQPPQTVWQGTSELLARDFRGKFDAEVIKELPRNVVENGIRDVESVLLIRRISQPKKIDEGKWQVDMVSDRVLFTSSDRSGANIPFNKKIFVRALDTQTISIPNRNNSLHSAVYSLNEARLEIYNICDIKDKSCSEQNGGQSNGTRN